MTRLILVFTITSILFSCSNSAKKDAAKSEATPVDTVRSIQELPEQQDSVVAIKEIENEGKQTSTGTEVITPKQDVPETAEQAKSQVHVKNYAIQKPVPVIKNDGYKVIAQSESKAQSIKHAMPASGAVVLPPQHTTEAHAEQVLSADTLTVGVGSENPAPETSEQKKKSARLAYSYSSEMKRNVSEDINVYVSIVNSSSFVKDTLMKIVAQQKDPNTHKTSTDSIVTDNILLFKRIKVILIDPESAFKVDSTFGNGWQDVDSIGDNRWRWTVVPLTNQPSAKLIIKVTAKTPTGAVKDINDRTFFINVKMTGPFQMLREWVIYLQEHPELFLTVIIIPLIAFFGKRYFDRKSKEQKP